VLGGANFLIAAQIEAAPHHCSSGREGQRNHCRQKDNGGQTKCPVQANAPRRNQQTLREEKEKPGEEYDAMCSGEERKGALLH
jgi:hypothetical protein